MHRGEVTQVRQMRALVTSCVQDELEHWPEMRAVHGRAIEIDEIVSVGLEGRQTRCRVWLAETHQRVPDFQSTRFHRSLIFLVQGNADG